MYYLKHVMAITLNCRLQIRVKMKPKDEMQIADVVE